MNAPRRQLARPGLSYFDANQGRLITETAELLDMKALIRERWPSLDIYYDDWAKEFVVTQLHQGVEKFVLSRKYCDDRILHDISKSDPTHRNFVDPEAAVDRHNAQVDREQDREIEEISGEFGERFIHALKKDGFYNHENLERRGRPDLRKKAINVGQRPEDFG